MPSIIAELDGDLENVLKHFPEKPLVLFDSNIFFDALVNYPFSYVREMFVDDKNPIMTSNSADKALYSHKLFKEIESISKNNLIVVPDFVRAEIERALINTVPISYKRPVDSWLSTNMGPYCSDMAGFNKVLRRQMSFRRGKNRKQRKKAVSRPKPKPRFLYLRTPFSGNPIRKEVYAVKLNRHINNQGYLEDPQLIKAYNSFFDNHEVNDCAVFHTAVCLADRFDREVHLITNDNHFREARFILSASKTLACAVSDSLLRKASQEAREPYESKYRFVGNRLVINNSVLAHRKLLE